jgi:hypothetical protein
VGVAGAAWRSCVFVRWRRAGHWAHCLPPARSAPARPAQPRAGPEGRYQAPPCERAKQPFGKRPKTRVRPGHLLQDAQSTRGATTRHAARELRRCCRPPAAAVRPAHLTTGRRLASASTGVPALRPGRARAATRGTFLVLHAAATGAHSGVAGWRRLLDSLLRNARSASYCSGRADTGCLRATPPFPISLRT